MSGGSQTTLGMGDTVTSTLGSISMFATSHGGTDLSGDADSKGIYADAEGDSGGVAGLDSASSTVVVTSPAGVEVGSGSSLTALNGGVAVGGDTGATTEANANATGGGVYASAGATATNTTTTDATVNIDQNATISGQTVMLLAQDGSGLDTQALTTTTSNALDADATSTSTLNTTAVNSINVLTGAKITGIRSVEFFATPGQVAVTDTAEGTANAAGGDTNATANDTLDYGAHVTTASGSSIVAGGLTVQTSVISATTTTSAPVHKAVLYDGGSSNSNPSYTAENTEVFNSDVTLTGRTPQLTILPDGTADQSDTDSQIPFTIVNNQIILGSLPAGSAGVAEFELDGSGPRTLSGNAAFHYTTSLGAITILNESSMDLVVNNLSTANANAGASVQVDAGNSSGFHYATPDSLGARSTLISITNSGNSNVYLDGDISNPIGTTIVTNTYAGRGIYAGSRNGSVESIQAGVLSLSTSGGNIGTTSARLAAQLVESANLAASISATAGANLDLSLSALNQTGQALLVSGTLSAGVVDLYLADGKSGTSTVPSAYAFNVAASKVNADTTNSSAVNLTFTSAAHADLDLGTITSRQGNVTLAAGGSIVDASGGAGTNVVGALLSLTAGGSIGSANDPIRIDAGYSGTGGVTATSSGDLSLSQTSGALPLTSVQSTGGTIYLTSAGSITDAGASAPPSWPGAMRS